MRLEQLKLLTEDELAMLWFIINKLDSPICHYELDDSLFTSIKHQFLIDKINAAESKVIEQHKSIYNSLKEKVS